MPVKNYVRIPSGDLARDLLDETVPLKEIAFRHKISRSWASKLRIRILGSRRIIRLCPHCHRPVIARGFTTHRRRSRSSHSSSSSH